MEEIAVTFAAPAWLWAFAVFPLLIALVFASERRRTELIAKIVATRLQPRLAGSVSVAKRRARFLFALLGLAGAILALARPQWGFTWEEAKRKGRDVIIAIDTSRSMLADDIKPNRLTRAKLAAQDLIEELGGDRVGVVAFAGTAFLQSPLTIDYAATLNALREIDTEIIPQGGTNLEGALRSAREAFGKGESENRALVIFSDGEELDADAKKAVEELKGQVRVFTVGVGTPQGALIPIRTRGRLEYVNDEAGNVVRTKLDESRLREVAEATGGFYLPLQTGRAEVQRIVRDGLGKMTEQDIDARLSRRPIERFQWPLGAGLAALVVSMLLGERRRVAVLAVLMLSAMANAKNNGVEAYERKDYERAQREFSEQLKRRPNLPELEFDLGAAAYKRGSYDEALDAFGRALTSEDAGLRGKAAYNLGNTLFQRGAAQQEKGAKLAEWREAIAKYEQALGMDPKNEDASYNRDVVRKLIEELEKEPPKQDEQKKEDKKDEEKKDEEKKDENEQQKQDQQQQQKDQQQSKDDQQQQQQGSQQQDQQKDSQGQEQKNEGKESQPKEQQGQQGQKDKQEGEQGNKPEPMPQQQGEKKEGELKSALQAGESQEEREAAEAQAEAQAAAEGRMTPQQARALLDSMKSEDEKVRLADPREKQGLRRVLKDW